MPNPTPIIKPTPITACERAAPTGVAEHVSHAATLAVPSTVGIMATNDMTVQHAAATYAALGWRVVLVHGLIEVSNATFGEHCTCGNYERCGRDPKIRVIKSVVIASSGAGALAVQRGFFPVVIAARGVIGRAKLGGMRPGFLLVAPSAPRADAPDLLRVDGRSSTVTVSKPARPLLQGMLSLGGCFLL